MRSGVVAGGITLMIIGGLLVGIIGFFFPVITRATVAGQVSYFLSIFGFFMLGIGFLTFIAGLAASPTPKATAPVAIVQQPAPSTVAYPPAPTAVPEVLVICPRCDARVSSRSKFCPECGEKLGPKQRAKPREVREEEETEALKLTKRAGFCMYCRAELPEGADFCPECGKEVK